MSTAAISIAEKPDDIAAVKQLCRDFVIWLHVDHPEQRENIQSISSLLNGNERLQSYLKFMLVPTVQCCWPGWMACL